MEVNTDIDGLKAKRRVGRVKYGMVKPGLVLAVDLGREPRAYNIVIKTEDEDVAMIMGTGELIHIEPDHPVESIYKFEYIPRDDSIRMVDISNKRCKWLLRK